MGEVGRRGFLRADPFPRDFLTPRGRAELSAFALMREMKTARNVNGILLISESAMSEKQVKFSFLHCSYTVRGKGKHGRMIDKKLVDNISAQVVSGEMLAIMGPSGAGKSTLLNMLTLEKGPGVAEKAT